jgi:hypothetical protein
MNQAASDALAQAIKLSKKLEGPYKVSVEICLLCYSTRFALIAHFKSSGF